MKFLYQTSKLIPPKIKRLLIGIPTIKMLIQNTINYIIIMPTFSCNYRCPYCFIITNKKYHKQLPKEFEHTSHEWIKALELFAPSMISISGGEPLIYEYIDDLLNNIPKKHSLYSITSNLQYNIDKILSLKDKVDIHASFHPNMTTKEEFGEKVLQLKRKGFNILVNLVAAPALLTNIIEFKDYFEIKLGSTFHIDPFLSDMHFYSCEEKALLKNMLKDKNRNLGYDFDNYCLKTCNGGSKYFVVIPNGDVFTCFAGFYYFTGAYPIKNNFLKLKSNFYLGNIFKGTFTPVNKKQDCFFPCYDGCDVDISGVKKI